ncbi:MAG: FhaA domain-containing protein [Gaiellaceae bacterium]
MSVLRSIEGKIEALFEGVFGRAFRTNVQPVELARKLAKEMDDHRVVSVSRVYVPNEYAIYLSPGDREQFSSYEDSLRSELQEYVAEHARRENYALTTRPRVRFETDSDLDVGVFGIATRMLEPSENGAPEAVPEPGATMIYRPETPPAPEPAAPPETPDAPPTLSLDGTPHSLDKERIVIGRSKDSDIRMEDPNASRRHAEVRREEDAYWLVDLDSTNGVAVNGRRTKRAKLNEGDTITIGSTDLVFGRSGT